MERRKYAALTGSLLRERLLSPPTYPRTKYENEVLILGHRMKVFPS